jgi:hypothetical protein
MPQLVSKRQAEATEKSFNLLIKYISISYGGYFLRGRAIVLVSILDDPPKILGTAIFNWMFSPANLPEATLYHLLRLGSEDFTPVNVMLSIEVGVITKVLLN